MLWRTAKFLFQLMGALGAGFAVIFSLLAWQLSKGPVSLGFLTEHLERALNDSHPNLKLKVGNTILTWAGWQRALDIRILDVTVSLADGSRIGRVPEAWFSLSGDALLQGKIAPRTIEIYGPRLSIRRDDEGAIDIGFGNANSDTDTEVLARGFLNQFNVGAELGQPMSHLTRVAIIGGAVRIRDEMLKRTWKLPVADIRIDRLDEGLRGEINLLLDQNGKTTELVGDGHYHFEGKRVSLNLTFTNVEPAVFSDLSNHLTPLKALEMPISGTLGIAFPLDDEIKEIRADIKGKGGKLVLLEPHRQELDVVSTKLKAKFNSGKGIELEEFDVVFAEDTKIKLPIPISHTAPLRRLSVIGLFSENGHIIELKQMRADLNGPILNLVAKLNNSSIKSDPKRYHIQGEVDKLATDFIRRHWPKSITPLPRKWIVEHISGGFVEDLSFGADVQWNGGGAIELVSISGGMRIRDIIVNYLPPSMPSVKHASASVRFDEKAFFIEVETGRSENLELVGGHINITGLDQIDQFADIDLNIKGGLRDQLAYINHKPFQFSSELGLNLNQADGDADTRLKLFFILEKKLSFKKIKLWARASVVRVRLMELFHGHGIDNGSLDVRLDTSGVDVKGNVEIAKVPAKITWRRNFAKRADFISKYRLIADIENVHRLRDMGLNMALLSSKYIRGGVKPDISYTVFDEENRRLEATVDITDAALSAPAFGWSKKIGKRGEAGMLVDLENWSIVDIPAFSLKAADLLIKGKANYALDGSGLEKIEFSQVTIGRTEMKGALNPKPGGGWDAGFHGPAFDLSPLWEEIMAEDDVEKVDHPFLDRLTLLVKFKKVWLDETKSLNNFKGDFLRTNNLWQMIQMSSRVGDDAVFDIQIQPRTDGNRNFFMHAQNAGEVFKVLDLYPNMIGGRLRIKGVYDDSKSGHPLKGNVVVDDYRIINAPALAHVFSIMSLTGILEALQGPGLVFTKLNIPFESSHGVFRLKDAKAAGTSLGFTASGKLFRHADIIDLEGTVVPAYLINSAFGHIPLLGSLLTGGEKGGGVFAATYTMTGPMEEPVVLVNPLSALTPGFLRNVFGIFSDSGTEKQDSGDRVLIPNPQ